MYVCMYVCMYVWYIHTYVCMYVTYILSRRRSGAMESAAVYRLLPRLSSPPLQLHRCTASASASASASSLFRLSCDPSRAASATTRTCSLLRSSRDGKVGRITQPLAFSTTRYPFLFWRKAYLFASSFLFSGNEGHSCCICLALQMQTSKWTISNCFGFRLLICA